MMSYKPDNLLWTRYLGATLGFLLLAGISQAQNSPSDTLVPKGKIDTAIFTKAQKLEDAFKVLSAWTGRYQQLPDTASIHLHIDQADSLYKNQVALLTNPRFLYNLRFLRGNYILSTHALNHLMEDQAKLQNSGQNLLSYERQLYQMDIGDILKPLADSGIVASELKKQQEETQKTWDNLRKISDEKLAQYGMLQIGITRQYIKTEFAHRVISEGLKEYNHKIYSNPKPLITTPKSDSLYMSIKGQTAFSVSFVKTMISHFWKENFWRIMFNLALFAFILIGILVNNKVLRSITDTRFKPDQIAPFVTHRPVAVALAIGFLFSPFLYTHIPAVIYEFIVVGQLLSITALLWGRISKPIQWRWVALCFLFIRFGIMNLLVGTSVETRWGLIGLNLGSIYLIWSSYRIMRKNNVVRGKIMFLILLLTILQQAASVVLNLMGYYDAAMMQSVNSVFSLTAAISISVVIQILKELMLTIDIRLTAHKMLNEEDIGQLGSRLSPYLTIIGLALWLMTFLNTLNVDQQIVTSMQAWLVNPLKIGSTSFTMGNVAMFLVVFLITLFASKLSGIIIDLFATRTSSTAGLSQLKNSKLFLRLSVLAIGVIIAFAASGIPMERLTFVLGALTVGIGLGLQHLVNNLVSGIIMAIERPMKVGDIVTMDNMTGKVTEIGLRSTTIESKNGTNIYIPNGEFLSGTLINHSVLKNRRLIAMQLLISEKTDVISFRTLVLEELLNVPEILKDPKPVIHINKSTEKGILAEVDFWISRTASESATKDKLMERLIPIFQSSGISFGSQSKLSGATPTRTSDDDFDE